MVEVEGTRRNPIRALMTMNLMVVGMDARAMKMKVTEVDAIMVALKRRFRPLVATKTKAMAGDTVAQTTTGLAGVMTMNPLKPDTALDANRMAVGKRAMEVTALRNPRTFPNTPGGKRRRMDLPNTGLLGKSTAAISLPTEVTKAVGTSPRMSKAGMGRRGAAMVGITRNLKVCGIEFNCELNF